MKSTLVINQTRSSRLGPVSQHFYLTNLLKNIWWEFGKKSYIVIYSKNRDYNKHELSKR